MSASPTTPSASSPRRPVVAPLIFVLLGIFGMAAVWTMTALIIDRQCAWMAAIAAADLALLLRIGRAAPGVPRAIGNVVATVLTIVVANWCIAAAQIGGPMGLPMTESLQRIGPEFAQTLLLIANRPTDWAWYAIAGVLALWLGR